MLILYVVVILFVKMSIISSNITDNWIGSLKHCKYWIVKNGLKWLSTIGYNWRGCKNSVYKIYPSSYIDKLINLCWYFWGGFFFPFRLFSCHVLSEKNLRTALGRGKYCSSGQDLICYLINMWLRAIKIRSIFNICIHGRGTY